MSSTEEKTQIVQEEMKKTQETQEVEKYDKKLYKRFSPTEKLEVLKLVNRKSIYDISARYGITAPTIYRWRRNKKKIESEANKISGFITKENIEEEKKIRELHNSIGERFKDIRIKLGLNQWEMAEIFGKNQKDISNIENNRITIDPKQLQEFNTVLGININFLLTGIGDMFSSNTILSDETMIIILKRVSLKDSRERRRRMKF